MQLITIFLLFIFKTTTILNDMLVGFHRFQFVYKKKQSGNFESVMETDLSKNKRNKKRLERQKTSADDSKSHIVDLSYRTLYETSSINFNTIWHSGVFFFQC